MTTTITINTSPDKVWKALTDTTQMPLWMGPDLDLTISTNWKINSPITIHGLHIENNGKVLVYEENKRLSYSHLSIHSHLPDETASYSILEFTLTDTTQLSLTIKNFPTDIIRRHLEFYWRTAIIQLKRYLE